jgi:hypothetical protein
MWVFSALILFLLPFGLPLPLLPKGAESPYSIFIMSRWSYFIYLGLFFEPFGLPLPRLILPEMAILSSIIIWLFSMISLIRVFLFFDPFGLPLRLSLFESSFS